MRLTRAGEYAVRCILYLSSQEEGAVVSRRDISEQMEIPDQFLGKIAQQLARAGLIEIVQGAKGGYHLLLSPSKIPLLAVVEAIIGRIFLNDCLMNPGSCKRSPSCSVNKIWGKARNQLRQTLQEISFEQLLQEENCFLSADSSGDHRKVIKPVDRTGFKGQGQRPEISGPQQKNPKRRGRNGNTSRRKSDWGGQGFRSGKGGHG